MAGILKVGTLTNSGSAIEVPDGLTIGGAAVVTVGTPLVATPFVNISVSGTGSKVVLSPAATSSIDNITIGATTPLSGRFTSVTTTSGGVGVGSTPFNWGTPHIDLQSSTAFGPTGYLKNLYYDGTNYRYKTAGAASRLTLNAADLQLDFIASGSAGSVVSVPNGGSLLFNSVGLGIGVSPTARVHIKSTLAQSLKIDGGTSSSGYIQFTDPTNLDVGYIGRNNASDLYLWNTTPTGYVRLGVNNTEALSINGSRQVIIGSTNGVTPSGVLARLNVISTGRIASLETTTARGGGSCYLQFTDPSGSKGGVGYLSTSDHLELVNTLTGGNVRLGTLSNVHLTVTTGGNVLIGTPTVDSTKLSVSTTSSAVALIESTASNSSYIAFKNTATTLALPKVVAVGDDLTLNTNGIERLKVSGARGNLAIGGAQDSCKLSIYGAGQLGAGLVDLAGGEWLNDSIRLSSSSTSLGAGGALIFANTQTDGQGINGSGPIGFAAIKGYLTDGAGRTSGGLFFSTRRFITDLVLTPAGGFSQAGNFLVGTLSDVDVNQKARFYSNTNTNVRIGVHADITNGQATLDLINNASSGSISYQNAGLVLSTFDRNIERARLTNQGYFKSSDQSVYTSSDGADRATHLRHHFQNSQNAVVLSSVSTSTGSNACPISSELPTGAAGSLFLGVTGPTVTFVVAANGNVTNTNNSYGSISDERLKENIVDAPDYTEKFKQLRFVKFNYKSDESKLQQFGLIAQEVQAIMPGLVDSSSIRNKVVSTKTVEKEQLVYEDVEVTTEEEVFTVENDRVIKSTVSKTTTQKVPVYDTYDVYDSAGFKTGEQHKVHRTVKTYIEEEVVEDGPETEFFSVKYSVLANIQGKVIQDLIKRVEELETKLANVQGE